MRLSGRGLRWVLILMACLTLTACSTVDSAVQPAAANTAATLANGYGSYFGNALGPQ